MLRAKKNLEGEINELEIAVDHSNKANNEAGKSIRRCQGKLGEVQKNQVSRKGMHMLYQERLKKQNLFLNQLNVAESKQNMNCLTLEVLSLR